jgi:hypothetical protein
MRLRSVLFAALAVGFLVSASMPAFARWGGGGGFHGGGPGFHGGFGGFRGGPGWHAGWRGGPGWYGYGYRGWGPRWWGPGVYVAPPPVYFGGPAFGVVVP